MTPTDSRRKHLFVYVLAGLVLLALFIFGAYRMLAATDRPGRGRLGVTISGEGTPAVVAQHCGPGTLGSVSVSDAPSDGTTLWEAKLQRGHTGTNALPLTGPVDGYDVTGSLAGVKPGQVLYITSALDDYGAVFDRGSVVPFVLLDLNNDTVAVDGGSISTAAWDAGPPRCKQS